jgi:hypothetical protein
MSSLGEVGMISCLVRRGEELDGAGGGVALESRLRANSSISSVIINKK